MCLARRHCEVEAEEDVASVAGMLSRFASASYPIDELRLMTRNFGSIVDICGEAMERRSVGMRKSSVLSLLLCVVPT